MNDIIIINFEQNSNTYVTGFRVTNRAGKAGKAGIIGFFEKLAGKAGKYIPLPEVNAGKAGKLFSSHLNFSFA